jgi:hypothetical protein
MNQLFNTITAGIILVCVMVNAAVAPLQSVSRERGLLEQAISAQSPLITLFVSSALPLTIVTEYFVYQNDMPRPGNSSPKKPATETGDTAKPAAAVHEKKISGNGRCEKRLVSFCGDMQGYSSASALFRAECTLAMACTCSLMGIVLLLVCIRRLPRSSTTEYDAVIVRMV